MGDTTMGALDGRVAVVTGAGRGIGREHALLMASHGAMVVVNDLGGANDGSGSDTTPAEEVVAEICAAGGQATVSTDDVSSWEGAKALIEQAVGEFGALDIVVNNAGILRDAFIPAMTEDQWDSVIAVHLKGHAATLHRRAARLAAGLQSLGVGPGDHYVIVMRNEPGSLEASVAGSLIGAVPVPVNWHWTGADLGHVLADCGAGVHGGRP